jgi:hypothetical protein
VFNWAFGSPSRAHIERLKTCPKCEKLKYRREEVTIGKPGNVRIDWVCDACGSYEIDVE